MLESNHTRAEIEARIAEKQARGKFSYESRAAQNHLSEEQALDWTGAECWAAKSLRVFAPTQGGSSCGTCKWHFFERENQDWACVNKNADDYDNEMERMDGSGMARGYSRSDYTPHFDRQTAEEWMRGLQNDDGTTGPHWTLEQAKQVMAQKEIGGSPISFWAALNMAYSDYCKVAKKLGVNTVDFYASIAEAFLNDKDAAGGGGEEKLARYYESVVQH